MRIYLIRHGRQNSGLCNVNVNLSPEGHRQAVLVGERLKKYNIEKLYCSDLIRAKETAKHISDALGLTAFEIPDIHEIDFGEWTGQEDFYLDEHWGQMRKDHYTGNVDVMYPGGESGEMCYKRFKKGMDEIIKDAKAKGLNSIAIVTHGMAMRAFICGIFNIPFSKRGVLAKSLENCSITELRLENDVYFLERFNDYAHLEAHDELLRKHFK